MDQETADYIVKHYSSIYNETEKLAIEHEIITMSLDIPEAIENYKKLFHDRPLPEEDMLEQVGLTIDEFNFKVAERLLYEHADKIFLNLCKRCQSLARTPHAKQCSHCGYDWH